MANSEDLFGNTPAAQQTTTFTTVGTPNIFTPAQGFPSAFSAVPSTSFPAPSALTPSFVQNNGLRDTPVPTPPERPAEFGTGAGKVPDSVLPGGGNSSPGPGGNSNSGGGQDQYAEDLAGYGTGKRFQKRFAQSVDDPKERHGVGNEGQYHRDRALFGHALNTHGETGYVLMLEIEIRGDPYWLGETNLDKAARLGGGGGKPEGTAPYTEGDVCFFFQARYPYGIDDQGVPVLTDENTLTGVFHVQEVESIFSNGTFKQNLKATRVEVDASTARQAAGDSSGGSGSGNGPRTGGSNTPANPPTAATSETSVLFQNTPIGPSQGFSGAFSNIPSTILDSSGFNAPINQTNTGIVGPGRLTGRN